MRRVFALLADRIRRLPPGGAVSLLGHSLLVAGLFLLPGVAAPPRTGEQETLVRVDPEAPPELVDPEPPPPERSVPAATEPVPVDATVVDAPPPEPEVFAEIPDAATDAPTAPADFRPSTNRVIGVGRRGPPAAESPAPAPAPAPAAAPKPRPPRPTPARILAQPLPEYPRIAEIRRLEGLVTLLVEVLPDGSVGKIEVKESSGHEVLDRAAIEGVRRWEFRPATVQGQPVRSLVEVPVRFTP